MRAALLGLLALAACEGGGDPVQQALRDVSAQRQAAAVKEGVTPAPTSRPAPASADAAHAARMIAGNEQALAAARAALNDSHDPEIRRMARAAIDARTREIAELRAWTPAG